MGRPPLPVGTWGAVRTERVPGGYRARARFRDYDGRTRDIERTRPTAGAARNALTEALAERSAAAGDDLTGSTRLSTAAAVWLAEKQGERDAGQLAVATVRRYGEVLTDHVEPALGQLMLSECTVTRVDRFLKATTEGVGGPTAKLCRTVLSGILGLAVRHGAINSNPTRDVGRIAIAKPEPRALSIDEVQGVRRALMRKRSGPGRPASPDTLDLVDLMITTGARTGEALGLRWQDVDLTDGVVSFTGTVARDEEGRLVRQTKPKSDTSRRRLRVPAVTVDMLLRRRVAVEVANVGDLVFPSGSGTVRDPSNYRTALRRALEGSGLEWVTPRHFRRTVATTIDRTAGLQSAADQLGHADTRVTSRHYVERLYEGPDVREALGALLVAEGES